MRKAVSLLAMTVAVFSMCGSAGANNLAITNVSLENVGGGMVDIEFDVSWSNSWRYEEMAGGGVITNHDAAWLFIKYRAGGDWKHVLLTDTGHTAPAGTTLKIGNNGSGTNVGAFLYRDADGHGGLVANNVRLHWDYVAGGLQGTNGVDISVHGIEMVCIPESDFYLGSGGTEDSAFYQYPSSTVPYLVTNEDVIAVGTTNGHLYYTPGADRGDGAGPIPASFPNGYAAFFCMKHEISQGQYAQFLNRVPSGIGSLHFPNAHGSYGHSIRLTNGVYIADWPDLACNYLSWSDLSAFLDWAGLRPMSELEYEKACRGPEYPVPNEFPWGDTTQVQISGFVGTYGSGTETPSPANANCQWAISSSGPARNAMRVGIFATAASTRHQAGAGYHGVLELAGSVEERIVTVGTPEGRAFLPTHGDGDSNTGNPGWPNPVTSVGAGLRGYGFYYESYHDIRASYRRKAAQSSASGRYQTYGGRGVRTDQ